MSALCKDCGDELYANGVCPGCRIERLEMMCRATAEILKTVLGQWGPPKDEADEKIRENAKAQIGRVEDECPIVVRPGEVKK